jgi:hypothetical protein
MLTMIVLGASFLLADNSSYQQLPRNFDHYDGKVQSQGGYETPQDRARREYQERWPQQRHCRLPACSTR